MPLAFGTIRTTLLPELIVPLAACRLIEYKHQRQTPDIHLYLHNGK
jgi:hypothetical protein